MTQESLWADFPTDETPKESPTSVLTEQAALVKDLSKGALIGKTVTKSSGLPKPHEFSTSMYIIAPQLDNYSLEILFFYHSTSFFPPQIEIYNRLSNRAVETKDMDHFKKALKQILSSQEVKDAIRSLLNFIKVRSEAMS